MADSTLNGLVIFIMCDLLMFINAAPMCNFDKLKYDEFGLGLCGSNGSVAIWKCHSCPHGLGLSDECGRRYAAGTKVDCVPCIENRTYSDTYDISQCKQCTRCQENEVLIGQCLPDKDTTQCICKQGYYRDRGYCKPCSWCCQDKSNDNVEECKHFEEKCSYKAKSCEPTIIPAPSTTTADPTTPAPKTTVHTAKQARTEESPNKFNTTTINLNYSEFESTPKDSEKTEKESSGGRTSGDILLPVVSCSIALPIILAIIYICWKRRAERSNPTQEQPLLVIPQGHSSRPTNPEEERDKTQKKTLICETYGESVINMPHDVKQEVCLMLNPIQKQKANDYRRVAEEIGLNYYQIENLPKENPMEDVFKVMITQTKNVDEFVDILFKIDRGDVVLKMYVMATQVIHNLSNSE